MRRVPRWVVIAAVVVVLAVATAVVVVQEARTGSRDEAAASAAAAVADAWQRGNLAQGSAFADAVAAQRTYEQVTAGLDGVHPDRVQVLAVERRDDEASARLRVTWPFGQGWTYETSLRLTGNLQAGGRGGRWTAAFTPDVVHPDLAEGDRLDAERTWPPRADVLGADGEPLVTATPVVEVGVQPSRAQDPRSLAQTLAGLLDVDPAALRERIAAADPDAFVPVVTLRRGDYDRLRDELQPLPGTVFRESALPLAPTREFARALLGTVGPVTAEIVEGSGGRLAPTDVAGLSGLQRQYDERLAGTPSTTVTRVRGEQAMELFAVPPAPGQPVRVTLDREVQQAADAALAAAGGGNGNAALVAVHVPTGEVRAVANTPVGVDRALTGRYPPGSTFKTASTLALLGTGLSPEETVPCPATATVRGRTFRNFEGAAAGPVPFRTDFAESCNTAFVTLSQRLAPGDLAATAATLGLGADWDLGVPAFPGSVPVEDGAVEVAAATIGQGEVLASPVAMAQAVAAVARGAWVPPRLVADPAPRSAPPSPPAAEPERLGTVRELMREVVLRGTASDLADVPGEPVHAKTGTAEFGTEVPPRTHAWTVGFQGDLAFAVLVEEGRSGGDVAVPVAEAFLRALP